MDTSSVALDKFVDSLVAEKFAESPLDPESLAEAKAQIMDRLNQYLTLRTIDTISSTHPEALEKLHALIKTNPDPALVNAFIQEHISEPDVLVAQILADFRSLYIGEEKKSN